MMMNAMQEPTTPYTRPDDTGQAARPVQAPPFATPQFGMRHPRSKSPAVAAILSAMPGLGQVYVGYYQRGFIHAVVVAGLIAVMNTGTVEPLMPLFGLFLAFFWMYNMIDAARRASLYNDALAGNPSIELPEDFKSPGLRGSLFGGATLVLAGFILLLHTRFGVSLDWVNEWWPVAPMIFGAYLLVRAVQQRGAGQEGSPR
jgi:cell wall-active antibiotic response 4TMS protein YvqF